MSESTDWVIQQVRDRADLVEVIGRAVPLKRSGSSYQACCPFHREKTPSFNVSPEKQLYHCFGCGASGDVFTFIQEYEGKSFLETLRELAEQYNIPFEASSDEAREAALREERKRHLFSLNRVAANFFQHSLGSPLGQQAQQYLHRERNLPLELIRDFQLGYAPDDWHGLETALKEEGWSLEDAVEVGLLKRSEKEHVYDLFRHRVMFPILGRDSRILGFGGRVFREGDKPKYLNSPESLLFQKSHLLYGMHVAHREIRRSGRAILCEGYMDVLRMHQHGLSEAIATLGTALTEGHALQIKRLAKELLFMFDSDAAGIKAVERALPITLEAGLSARVLLLPPGEDPDSYLELHGRDSLVERIESDSRPALDFWLDHLFEESSHDPVQIKAATEKAVFMIRGLQDQILQNYLLKAVAARVGVTADYLREQFFPRRRKWNREPVAPPPESSPIPPELPPELLGLTPSEPDEELFAGFHLQPPPLEDTGDVWVESAEVQEETDEERFLLLIVKCLMENPDLVDRVLPNALEQYLRSPILRRLWEHFLFNLREGGEGTVLRESLLRDLEGHTTLRERASRHFRHPFEENVDTEGIVTDTLAAFVRLEEKRQNQRVNTQLRTAEQQGLDKQSQKDLLREKLQRLARQVKVVT